MSAYWPHASGALAALAVVALTLGLALGVTRIRAARTARAAGWALVLAGLYAADRVTAGDPPGFRMLAVIAVLLFAMKAIVSVEASAREDARLAPVRWVAFATLWPGMRPALFIRRGPQRHGAWPLVARGLAHAAAGAALVAAARVTWTLTASGTLASMALLPGLSLLLHFGAFDVLAGSWRRAGVDVGPLFRAPLRAASLGEFWSQRWNVAFSEMTALAVYRPLSAAAGRRVGLLASFLLSGLLHEAAISLPVRAGFGGPLAYFAIHGVLTLVERERGAFGRVATLAGVALPLPLLFHAPFLRGVVWPLLGPR